MESSKQVYLSKKCDKLFRTFTENDNLIALYGIQNFVLGGWKTEDLTSFEKLSRHIPENLKVNGFALIYNDNVYEDFDTVVQEKLEKIKNSLANFFEKNIYVFILKDMKYTDDFEELNYEKTAMFRVADISDEIETQVKIDANFENFYKQFVFLNSDIKLEFHNKEGVSQDKDSACVSINYENFEKDIKEVFSNENFFVFLENEKFLIDKVRNLEAADIDKITTILKKFELNTNSGSRTEKINNIKLFFGFKDKSEKVNYVKQINIVNFCGLANNAQFNFNFSVGGYISYGRDNINSEYFANLVRSFQNNLLALFYKLKETRSVVNRLCIYNPLFTTHPVYCFKAISFNEDKTQMIKNGNILDKDLYTSELGLISTSFFDFHNQISTFNSNKYTTAKLINPHLSISRAIPQHSAQFCVKGNYEYYHYKHDGYSDEGWGCAYRSLQTLFSWFLMNGFKKEGVYVPSILDIQKTLVKVGDKPNKIIDSNDWIGAFEVSIVLNELLGIESQIMFVASGADLENKGRDLIAHFETNGTPIMIGGGVYAYTILGVEYDRVKGKCMFLILDPHYPGADDVKVITSKGWCAWKDASLFKKEEFYNLCLPHIPK